MAEDNCLDRTEPTQAKHLKLLFGQVYVTPTHTPLTKTSLMAKPMSMEQEGVFPTNGEAWLGWGGAK